MSINFQARNSSGIAVSNDIEIELYCLSELRKNCVIHCLIAIGLFGWALSYAGAVSLFGDDLFSLMGFISVVGIFFSVACLNRIESRKTRLYKAIESDRFQRKIREEDDAKIRSDSREWMCNMVEEHRSRKQQREEDMFDDINDYDDDDYDDLSYKSESESKYSKYDYSLKNKNEDFEVIRHRINHLERMMGRMDY